MRMTLGKFVCADCSKAFEAPLLGEASYGEFLLWSRNGNAAYLNTFEDGAFDDVHERLTAQFPHLKNNSAEGADILHAIFGALACDPDSAGAPYLMSGHPPCPGCGATSIKAWDLIYPLKVVELDIPSVTHSRWNSMTETEKAAALANSVAQARRS